MLEKIRNKKASITTITLFAIMCFLFPMLGVIYDIGLIHIYKQDIKNIQDLSGTTCTPIAENKGLSQHCKAQAEAYVMINLTGNASAASGVGQIPHDRRVNDTIKGIQKYRNMSNMPNCNGVSTKTRICKGQNFDIFVDSEPNGVGGIKIHITTKGIYYKPMFLTGALFSFIRVKNFDSKNNIYELKIPTSTFSSTYSYSK